MLSFVPNNRDPRAPPVVRSFLRHLEERGAIDRIGAERALQAQSQTGHRIDTVLTELGLVQDRPLLDALSSFVSVPIVEAKDFPSEPVSDVALPIEYLRANNILPLTASTDGIVIAMSDPFADDLVASVAYSLDRQVEPRLSTAADISAALERLYLGDTLEDPGRVEHGAFASDEDIQRLKDIASEAPVIKIVSRLITSAATLRASDVHIEPMSDHLRVRYRIDGVMLEAERLPPDLQAAIASRIKILARLNIAERRLPQDGRAKFVAAGREIDLRISTTPVMHGESIVLRLLDQSRAELDFTSLGFDSELIAVLTSLLAHPNGIVLVTGPTGSGKTTTLYASLRQLNTVDRKIFTVEDPIEYNLTGINQMQIKPDIGLDFAQCLRSILRQDPDTIMIGEMRDLETARIGIQSSLTGHLVLSTLHTNSAAASIARLLDMGAEDYLLASTLKGIIAQRLVRRLCSACATPAHLGQDEIQRLVVLLGPHAKDIHRWTAKNPVGCPECNGIGFKGRTTIYEALVVDDAIQAEIRKGQTEAKLDAISRARGMVTLLQSGVLKVIQGETTLAEVSKAVRT